MLLPGFLYPLLFLLDLLLLPLALVFASVLHDFVSLRRGEKVLQDSHSRDTAIIKIWIISYELTNKKRSALK